MGEIWVKPPPPPAILNSRRLEQIFVALESSTGSTESLYYARGINATYESKLTRYYRFVRSSKNICTKYTDFARLYFLILEHFATKLSNFTNFKTLF